jgi:hypothetical protein
MSQDEIQDAFDRTGSKPVFHEDAAVQVLVFNDDQWVAYDDEKTLRIKAEYAQSPLFGRRDGLGLAGFSRRSLFCRIGSGDWHGVQAFHGI